jgi:iron complex outermembrane receptor protein
VRYPQLGEKQVFGDPSVSQHNLFLNTQYDITNNVQFYAFGSYHERDAISDELYRNPYLYSSAIAPAISAIYPNGYQPLCKHTAPIRRWWQACAARLRMVGVGM